MYAETQSDLLLLYQFVGFVLEGCNKLLQRTAKKHMNRTPRSNTFGCGLESFVMILVLINTELRSASKSRQ